jgi:N-dimethylarginine dimethylaminohydrolase
MNKFQPTARILMCAPEHFAVAYRINPWMDPVRWERHARAQALAARAQWAALHGTLRELGAAIELVPPAAGLPDLVFTANAAVVLDRKALLARFRYPQRQGEEAHFAAAFNALQAQGLIDSVKPLPDGIVLEGAGDCVWDAARAQFWLGWGPRSDLAARRAVEERFGFETVALELADPRFYHMDTALSPLPHGEIMCLPQAFTAAGRAAIRARVPAHKRIEISPKDGAKLAANAVCLGDTIMLSACSNPLRAKLAASGYRVITVPLDAFLESGGSAFCLTLRLDRQSGALAPTRRAAAAA